MDLHHRRAGHEQHCEVYRVEEIPDRDGEAAVEALAADYVAVANQACAIPMAHTLIDVPNLAGAA